MDPTGDAQVCHRKLLDLPSELVIQLVQHLAKDKKTLCTLARTCHLLQAECEKHIYTTIELLSTNDLDAILLAFRRRPERVASVETLKILYHYHDALGATSQDRAAFNYYVPQMRSLRDWHVESPYDNFKWGNGGNEWVEKDMVQFRKALEDASLDRCNGGLARTDVGLAKLEKLILHSHGAESDFWDLEGYSCLFRHPTLRYLHISCVNLPDNLPELEPYTKTTPLITLIFDECELQPRSLRRILQTPKSLKNLTLGENVYNTRRGHGINPNLSKAPQASLEALKAVAHSLEALTHLDPQWRLMADPTTPYAWKGGGMRDFHRLKSLDIDPCSFLHHMILCATHAPPNIETLRLHYSRQAHADLFSELPPHEPYTYLGSLKSLEYVQAKCLDLDELPAAASYICDAPKVRERHSYAYKLYKHGINMKLYLEATDWSRAGLIPPYLNGEAPPELVCVYDAAALGFHRYIDRDDALLLDRSGDQEGDEGLHQFNGEAIGHPCNLFTELPEPPETDQLQTDDILQLKNGVRRKLGMLRGGNGEADSDAGSIDISDDFEDEDDEDESDWEDDEDGFDDIELLHMEMLPPGMMLTMLADVPTEDEDEDEDEDADADMDDLDEDNALD